MRGSVLILRGRRQVDHAQLDKRAVKAALPLRGRREIAVTAMLKQAGARGKYPVKRQACLLQGNRSQKGDIQICALPDNQKPTAPVVPPPGAPSSPPPAATTPPAPPPPPPPPPPPTID